ncbi:MAG: dihydropyrimidinase [Kiritimatiellae bacterium]|nr:dihydropyrimidinase [Kiritimatiellia bacterium]
MSLLIRGGEIITADSRFIGDLLCEGETISHIGEHLTPPNEQTTVIDARGKYVFPGFVDPHVHAYLPFCGTQTKDTYTTASRAALLGGTTCFIDFISPERYGNLDEALKRWHEKSRGQSACDYAFHMTVTHFDEAIEKQLRRIVREEGITSFKVYLAYKGSNGIEDADLFQTLRLARELNVLVTAHCENETLVDQLQKQLLAQGKTGPEWHYHSRPPCVEADGVHHLMTFAELTGAHVYVVHTTCAEALHELTAARERGVHAWGETCPQYLLLDQTYAERPHFEGAKYVLSPPLRAKHNQEILWRALSQGELHTVATDHAPTDFATQKAMGRNDFTRITNGVPGIQDRINLLYTYGVERGLLDLHRLVELAATQPARLFGLYPAKGTIQVGSDADLVVYDPNYPSVISAKTHAMNVDYNAYEGMPLKGRADTVTVRGKVVVQAGCFVGDFTHGHYLARQNTQIEIPR